MIRDKMLAADLETSQLHLKTHSSAGTVMILLLDIDLAMAGIIGIEFNVTSSSILKGNILICEESSNSFSVDRPAKDQITWTVTKRGRAIEVYCNGEQVFDVTASLDSCGEEVMEYYERRASVIYFSTEFNTASKAYYIG